MFFVVLKLKITMISRKIKGCYYCANKKYIKVMTLPGRNRI